METQNKIDFDFNPPQDPYVEVYGPDDKLVLRTNDDRKFLWICCQIKDHNAEGYYVIVPEEGKKYPIGSNGRTKDLGGVAFKTYGELLRKLV